MKKLILTLALAAVAAVCANAQIGIGLGYTTKSFTGTYENEAGLYVGANYNIELTNGLAVAPGIDFAMLSYKDSNYTQKENYIAVPVMFNYGIEFMDGFKLVPYLGPTFSFGLSSVSEGKIGSFTLSGSNYGDNSDYAQFDILIGGGVALDVMDMIRVSVGYNQGLLDRDNNDNSTIKTSGVNFGVAYLF